MLRSRVDWPLRVTADDEDIPVVRCIKLTLVAVSASNTMLDRYSEWNSLIRTTSWLLRFSHNAKATKITRLPKMYGPLTVTELARPQTVWLQYVRSIEFKEELTALRKWKLMSSKSRLKSLNPFIDQDGLVRVGGRLSLSSLSDQRKFPIVLPPSYKITRMIFKHEHNRLLHAGPQALLASIHTGFWPLRGRDTARFTGYKCITCFRHHPTTLTPCMAPLPRQRTNIERPFTHTGVDFCGPISVRSGIRRVTSTKAYISVFAYFSTRAIHLELVNGLTSNAFIAALKRFIGHRGSPQHMYSDNGTNFVGANKELRAYIQQLYKDYHLDKSIKLSGMQWHFNPPATPYFGGLWESAVKSTKTHLVKCTKGALLTFEELSTLLCQVEAVLNSRPMTSLSTDPSDYSALTTSHFRIGSPLTQVLEPTIATEPRSNLKRWELVRFQSQHFWNRWSREYLPQLQKRGRWLSLSRPVKVGDLAISEEDNKPARQWKLVRITAVHAGLDGITRVKTIRNSADKECQCPVVKLAVHPTSVDEDNEHEVTIN